MELLPSIEGDTEPSGVEKYGFYTYNFFLSSDHVHLRYVWSVDNLITDVKSVFTDARRMHGKHFTIGKLFTN